MSELAGLNLEDLDRGDGWIRVRGKGRKERQVPLPRRAAEALERYLAERPVVREEHAVFLNHRNKRLTDRGISLIVKFYAIYLAADPSVHPHSFRHAYATHLLSGARTCAPSRNCSATRASPPPRSTPRSRSPT